MKRVLVFFSFLVIATMIAPLCFAGFDYTNPANHPTYQTWVPAEGTIPSEFPTTPPTELPYGSGDTGTYIPWPQYPTETDNLYPNPESGPTASSGDGWEWEWTEGWGTEGSGNDEPIVTWHFDGVDPEDPLEVTTLRFDIPNYPAANPLKEIIWTMVSDKAPKNNVEGFQVTVVAGGAAGSYGVSYPIPQPGPIQLGGASSDGGIWYRYSGVIQIMPNPEFETLSFDIYECTNIAEVTIQTVCVPEPGTITLLFSAGLGLVLVVIRRRRS